jgi:hypothetical protein
LLPFFPLFRAFHSEGKKNIEEKAFDIGSIGLNSLSSSGGIFSFLFFLSPGPANYLFIFGPWWFISPFSQPTSAGFFSMS